MIKEIEPNLSESLWTQGIRTGATNASQHKHYGIIKSVKFN